MFQLKDPTNVTLLHINVRTEKHGKEDVDAYDLDFSLTGQNSDVLALLQPGLCEFLYYDKDADDGQEAVPGVPKVLPDLRFPKLAAFAWPLEGTGYDLGLIYGLGDDKSNVKFESGKAVCKRAENEEGGTSKVFFRYSTSSMPDGALDKLRRKLKQQVTVTLVQPEKLRNDAVIDGTVGHPGLAAQQEAEAAGQQRLDGDGATPESVLAAAVGNGPGDDGGHDDDTGGDDDGEGSAPDAGGAAAQATKRGRKSAAVH